MVNINFVEYLREFVLVFGSVDYFGGSVVDFDVLLMKCECNVVRGLIIYG